MQQSVFEITVRNTRSEGSWSYNVLAGNAIEACTLVEHRLRDRYLPNERPIITNAKLLLNIDLPGGDTE